MFEINIFYLKRLKLKVQFTYFYNHLEFATGIIYDKQDADMKTNYKIQIK